MKDNKLINNIQLSLPLIFSLALAIGFFVDLREFNLSIRLPSIIVVVVLIGMIIWAIVNVFAFKNSANLIIGISALTFVPFLIIDILFSAGWLAIFTGALFITIPLTASSLMCLLIGIAIKKGKR